MEAVRHLRKMRWIALVIMVIISGFLVGCTKNKQDAIPTPVPTVGQNFNVSVTDSTGEIITLTKKPERIVSLAPSTTEILYFLGLESKIVGRTKYCNYPESLVSVPEIGGTSNPNIEAVVDLAPDLVVASTHVSDEVINKLREVGIPVVFLNEQENFEGTYSAIRKIGQLTGAGEEAEIVIEDMKSKLERVASALAALNKEDKPTVYYATGYGESDYGAGGNTFIGEIITLAGGDNIAKDVQGWSISKEQIAQGDPDIIIVPTGGDMKANMEVQDFYKDLRAIKEGHIYEIDGDSISRQGPRIADALTEMAFIINPELELDVATQ
ncbi:ABC transporter substrate-binding protein [Sporanaerobium hydrogeniformans]|uniref:ABC transporter substrate-binding protein n=1 Tax=Sporanaerobium hydrogeniformans TaxID=3072179 RepID=A0AC61DC85_9FIRM|nr:ABC transporter substrate-binding protein [Sporanaerobium hydrogeniformans]PHV70845.1 ABC transporter substrate-binding protein [Sporanaerobium hydrogeniformans]